MARGQSLYDWCQNNGEWGQQLLNEWTGLDENNNTIDINNIARASNKKVQWKCTRGHIWTATISHRTLGRGCPYCAGYKVTNENSLKTWCQNNGEWGQQLLQEWTGLDENNTPIDINNIARASNKKFHWRCGKGHTWTAVISHRTSGRGCPYCAGYKVTNENSLKTWCQENGEFGQQLLNEWTGLDENNTPIDINNIARGTKKKVQWKCAKGHTWIAAICNRTSGSGCPYCARNRVTNENSLKTWCQNNGEFGQQLLNEWTGLDENNTPIDINNIARASNKKVQWKCAKGHIWTAAICSRTSKEFRRGCPYCAGNLVTNENSFKTWCQENGEFGQQLLQEWTGLDENNTPIDINSIARASNKKFHWRCIRGHIWAATIYSRTLGRGCPYCNSKSTSFPEQFIHHSLKQLFTDTITRGKYQGYEYDITIPKLRLCIEYSDIYWHSNKLDRDEEKRQLCKEYKVNFLQIYAHKGQLEDAEGYVTDDSYTKEQIIYKVNYNKDVHIEQLIQIVKFILEQYAPEHTIEEINFEQAETDANNTVRGNIIKDEEMVIK